MLKHCQATAAEQQARRSKRSSLDNSSLNSSGSNSFNSSFGSDGGTAGVSMQDSRRSSYSSPEPMSIVSRSSSFASLNLDHGPKTPIKVFAQCLRPDIEYKTLSVGYQTTCKEMVKLLLAKFKMKNRDPNLFYLTMDIHIKRTGIPLQRTLVLEDDAKPAELKSCQPWGECKFSLQMRKGGLVRIHDSVLMAESKYKCLMIAETTTVEEVISLLFSCYGLDRIERVDRYCIVEHCQSQCYERRLHPTDRPAQVQSLWPSPSQFMFVLKRNDSKSMGSVGSSPASSEIDTMDVSYPSPSSSNASTPISSPVSGLMTIYERKMTTNFRLNGPVTTSIHESGLPKPPPVPNRPKHLSLSILPSANTSSNRSSLGSLSSGSRASSASFHDYENYFYI